MPLPSPGGFCMKILSLRLKNLNSLKGEWKIDFTGEPFAGNGLFAITGPTGAGKTTLVRGILRALGHVGKVKSPTYTIVEPYNLPTGSCYHFDLYRFQDPEEWEAAGFRDYFNATSICMVEWPENAGSLLPIADIEIRFDILPHGRVLHITSQQPLSLESLC
eukprot:gene8076-9967_t